MSSATGRRIGLGVAKTQPKQFKNTPVQLSKIGGKEKYVSVWDAL
jgi:hypothetical protein